MRRPPTATVACPSFAGPVVRAYAEDVRSLRFPRFREGSPRRPAAVVHTVTDAHKPLSEDIDHRQRRYLISMGIRTVCVLLVVVLPNPWRWIAAAGAIFLPYIAVVVANGGREPDNSRFEEYTAQPDGQNTQLDHRPEIRS